MNANPTDFEAYLATVPVGARATLQELRRIIKAIAPDAVESISYGMPTFKYRGRPLIYLGAAKKHCALYGMNVDAFKGQLTGYDTAKGTIRFPPDEAPPESLVKILVDARIAEIEAALSSRKRRSSGAGS